MLYGDPQDLLELTPKKHVLFIIGDWNAKIGSQEIPGVIGKFGHGVQNETGQRLIDFFQSVSTAEFSRFAGILGAALSQHHLLGF